MDKHEIKATLSAAKLYLENLRNISEELTSADNQISSTYTETTAHIKRTFTQFRAHLMKILTERENALLMEAENIRTNGMAPLTQCRHIINEKITKTNTLLDIGDGLLNGNRTGVLTFDKESCLLGSLPEIPELKEVPFISFLNDDNLEREVEKVCLNYGEVSRIAPIQINQIVEKPGALQVDWQTVENDDKSTDIQCFRLQRAYGDVNEHKHLLVNFQDCFSGLESQFLVKDCQPRQAYSFRVACKYEGFERWSPWSLPQVGQTSLRPFSWRETRGFQLSSDGKIVTPCDGVRDGVIYSDGPQFAVGHSVEFTFLEVDQTDCVIGLFQSNSLDNLRETKGSSFLLDNNGNIFVDGVKKSTILSQFKQGLKVGFTADLLENDEKVRIHIDSSDKRVTYDWLVNVNQTFHFAAQFSTPKWKLIVE